MKFEVQGRVVSHNIFQPNAKDYPDLELVKIGLVLTPATSQAYKHTKAVLVVEKDAAWTDLVLGRVVSITVRDSQQDALLSEPSTRGEGVSATVSMTDPKTGEVLSAPLTGLARAMRNVKPGPRGRAH